MELRKLARKGRPRTACTVSSNLNGYSLSVPAMEAATARSTDQARTGALV
jgi:hypothetical protein